MVATIRGKFNAYKFINELDEYIEDWFSVREEDAMWHTALNNLHSINLVLADGLDDYYYDLIDDIRFDFENFFSLTIDEQ